MHHCITYMYIHFQQNLVSRLVKTVYTNLFAKHRELHKFTYYQIVILKNRLFQTCIIVWHTSISIFSKIGLVDQPKSCTQMYLQKIISCINLQLPIVISNKSIIADIRHRKTYMYLNFLKKWINIDHTFICKKIVSCINLQLPIVILKKNNISDMHHCVTYM